MTGAPIPPGCDAVVMHERTRTARWRSSCSSRHRSSRARTSCRTGAEMQAGAGGADAGLRALSRRSWDVLASVGRTDGTRHSSAARLDRADRRRAGRAGRNAGARSNPQLERRRCFAPWRPKRARSLARCRSRATSPPCWHESLDQALDADVVLVTGGVSAGQRDLVPDVSGIARRAQSLPQDQLEAGQTALVRSRAAARWPHGCPRLRAAGQPGERPRRLPAVRQAGA